MSSHKILSSSMGPRLVGAGVLLSALFVLTPASYGQSGRSRSGPSKSGKPAKIALAPLETLGSEAKVSRATTRLVARALGGVAGYKLVADKKVRRAIRKNPRLKTCAGNGRCLAKLGPAAGAQYVVFGEVGGLGSAEVVYLQLIDARSGKTVRSTTLELGQGNNKQAARGAAYQLLAPERYAGRLVAKVDIEGASIYVDGQRLGQSPSPPVNLSVGSHAVRITHPEYRDYVRFVDIRFDQNTDIKADLQQFPIVATDITQNPKDRPRQNIIYQGQEPTPWYRTWKGVAGVAGASFVVGAIFFALAADGIDFDTQRIIAPRGAVLSW